MIYGTLGLKESVQTRGYSLTGRTNKNWRNLMSNRGRFVPGTVILAIATGLLCSSPAWSRQSGDNLFPTKKGSSWTFAGTAGGQKLSMASEIFSSTASGGKATVVMRWTQSGQPVQDE